MAEKENFEEIVRIVDRDIPGKTKLYSALRRVKGVGFNFSNAICESLGLDKQKQVGYLSEEEVKKIGSIIKNPESLPKWMLNRQKDIKDGKDKHIVSGDLKLINGFDVKRLQRIKSYRGMRHAAGLPCRGQRTRGHFRKGKSMGVVKKAVKSKKG